MRLQAPGEWWTAGLLVWAWKGGEGRQREGRTQFQTQGQPTIIKLLTHAGFSRMLVYSYIIFKMWNFSMHYTQRNKIKAYMCEHMNYSLILLLCATTIYLFVFIWDLKLQITHGSKVQGNGTYYGHSLMHTHTLKPLAVFNISWAFRASGHLLYSFF